MESNERIAIQSGDRDVTLADPVVLGTVLQPEPTVLNDILGEDDRVLNASEYTLIGTVDNALVTSSALVEERASGVFEVYELDNEQLNTLVDSPYLSPAINLEQTLTGDISVVDVREPAFSLERVDPANEGIGNRYAGPIVARGDDDTLVQRVGSDLVAHRADALEGVSINPQQPVEISYEFDGASVRTLNSEQDLSIER